MFAAARRRDCDLKIWGHAKNAGLGGPFQTFQRCRTMPLGKVFVTGDWNDFNTKTEDVDPENGARELFDDGALVNASRRQNLKPN